MDSMTPQQRHRCMASIRGKDTGPEMAVRRMVHAMGFRYRLHVRALPGCPDIVLPRHRKIIFVHGCFWHAHGCAASRRTPATNKKFWKDKFTRNKERDAKSLQALWRGGWQVLVIWECETKEAAQLRTRIAGFLAPAARAANYPLNEQHALYGMVAEASEFEIRN